MRGLIALKLRSHPNVLFAYSPNFVEIILRVENHGKEPVWCEAEVRIPENISLSPTGNINKGKVRIGILTKKEYLEKSVRVFANNHSPPQVYRATVTLFIFNKDGIIETRIEKPIDIRCELKKKATL